MTGPRAPSHVSRIAAFYRCYILFVCGRYFIRFAMRKRDIKFNKVESDEDPISDEEDCSENENFSNHDSESELDGDSEVEEANSNEIDFIAKDKCTHCGSRRRNSKQMFERPHETLFRNYQATQIGCNKKCVNAK